MTDLLVRTEPLGGSALARAALSGSTPDGWYATLPGTPDGWRQRLESMRADAGGWAERLAPAMEAGGEAARRIAASAGGRGVVVTTGQQPGLFGGPVYTWSKALSALALADELERATGIPVAPVFWAATDDADFAEAASTWVSGPDGAERLELDPPAVEGLPLSRVPLGAVERQFEALVRAAGSSADPVPIDAARRAYLEGGTVGDAYVTLLRALLEPLGIAVLDASHPAVRQAADPLLRSALRDASSLASAVDARVEAITAAGYTPQVATVPGLSLVSLTDDEAKSRVSLDDAGRVAADPGAVLGTTVLLRPVVERFILPTAAYVAGPGEIAYFAQVSAVADALEVGRPLVVARWSCTLLEPRTRELLDEYDLDVDALADPHAPERELARALLPPDVSEALAALRKAVARTSEQLVPAGEGLVPDAVPEGFARELSHRLERLERRYRAAVRRQGDERFRDLERLRGALYPGGVRQERALNLLPLMARHGRQPMLDAMLAGAREHARSLVNAVDAQRAGESASDPATASAVR